MKIRKQHGAVVSRPAGQVVALPYRTLGGYNESDLLQLYMARAITY
jgi:hypothetical protein